MGESEAPETTGTPIGIIVEANKQRLDREVTQALDLGDRTVAAYQGTRNGCLGITEQQAATVRNATAEYASVAKRIDPPPSSPTRADSLAQPAEASHSVSKNQNQQGERHLESWGGVSSEVKTLFDSLLTANSPEEVRSLSRQIDRALAGVTRTRGVADSDFAAIRAIRLTVYRLIETTGVINQAELNEEATRALAKVTGVCVIARRTLDEELTIIGRAGSSFQATLSRDVLGVLKTAQAEIVAKKLPNNRR